jgi:hypothetical protein
MKPQLLALLIAGALASSEQNVHADSIELYNGTVLEGEFVGSSNDIILFNAGENIEAFPQDHVVAVYFSAGVERALKYAETEPDEAPAATSPPAATDGITVPTGTRLVLRMSDTVDSSRHPDGHRFRAQLESALVVNGKTVAPRDTVLHGRVASSRQGGRLRGSSEMSIQITDVMLNEQLVPISTGELTSQTQNEARNTVGRSARGAAIGAMFGGGSGARTGAAVGASASLLTRGARINIPQGTILETTLSAPLEIVQP